MISGIPKGSGIDDIKKFLAAFQNEYYPERKGAASQSQPVYLHFYSLQRAIEAQQTLRTGAHQFGGVELVSHRKEIGTNQERIKNDDSEDSDNG